MPTVMVTDLRSVYQHLIGGESGDSLIGQPTRAGGARHHIYPVCVCVVLPTVGVWLLLIQPAGSAGDCDLENIYALLAPRLFVLARFDCSACFQQNRQVG